LWYGYYPGYKYIWGVAAERAVKINVDEFGLEYPINLNAIDSYLYDPGFDYMYRVYDTDGSTLLWESPVGTAADDYYNIASIDPALVLKNDFWISVVPLSGGNPRLISSDVVESTHSYFGAPGAWNEFNSGGERFEWVIDFALSPYMGIDIFPPLLRDITGFENFEGFDATVTLTVQDQSPVNSPMLGQYDIGAGWINFDVTQAKGTYTFVGTIPGQPDGTTANVRFFMEDSEANSAWSDIYQVMWSRDLPLLSEGFEGDFPPAGWTLDTVGSGFVKATSAEGALIHTGKAVLCHWDTEFDNADWIWSPVITIPAVNFCTVSFWQSSYWTSYYELHRMVVSTDGGATYDVLYEGFPPEEEPDYSPWEQIFASLAAYAGMDIQVGFYYQGNYMDQWFVDDVLVQYDYSGPEIVSLVGNEALLPVIGAYVNNELIINATVFDLSGVASVIGHYSFDGGITVVDLPFAKAKSGNELWTATIPAEAAAVTGTINFDMADIGGLVSPTTADYPIEFVTDIDPPVIKSVNNRLVFLNEPMNLEVIFEDESAITSCTGYFTTNQSSWYKFELTPAKIHEYTYLGTIPAQATEVFDNGFVYFEIADEAGNVLTTDQYQVQWLDGQQEVFEDFESGLGNWGVTGNWGLEVGTYTSATNALTESPYGDYTVGNTSFAMWANPMDWSLYYGADIAFWCKYDIEAGFDYMYFQGTGDNGMTWITLATWDGEGVDWHEERISMDAFVGQNQVSFRFYFISDGTAGGSSAYEVNGMYIDDITLNTYNADYAGPTIIADPYAPLFYEGALAEYTDAIQVIDISGVAGLRVDYSVDGAAEEFVLGTDTGAGNMWSFTIPLQAAGSQVNYRFTAVDLSPRGNQSEKGVYKYFAGDHKIYDAGIVSYYMTLDGAAWAEKISIGGEWWFADLTTALIRNYCDASHISADMVFHVWEDNAGVPGDDMIVPFDVTAEASPTNTSAMTRIDLRPYGLRPNGDFWIGITAPYGIVYSTMESTDETGTTAYQRSFTGSYNGTSWDWTLQALDNWHFRAVIGETSGIEENNVPSVTELKQNYPNPFNPATTINFNLAKDAKVSLVVYDVMGRKVADLVNKNMVSGSHKVSFDASNLVSGVYYYTLKAGEVNQTKKMMLIK